MTAACATGRLHVTSLFFARSLSTWSPGTGAPKPAYVAGARRLPGTTATCSKSLHAKLMREPWGTSPRLPHQSYLSLGWAYGRLGGLVVAGVISGSEAATSPK